MIRSLLISLFLLFVPHSFAAQCTKTGSTCVDAAACKKISGVDVCLADLNATCWKYTDTYNCVDQTAVDYCAAISSTPGCQQVNSVCASPSSSGCMRWTNTYQCGGGTTQPTNTVVLDSTYTIVTDTINTSACDSFSSNPTCQLASHVCTEPAGTRVINGLSVYKDCWAWQDSYSCLGSVQSDCSLLTAKGCSFGSSTCLSPTGATGTNCLLKEKTYSCPSAAGSTTVLDCGSQQYCTGGNCFNAGHEPDGDLAAAVVAHEVGRQGATYIDANQRLFSGNAESCVHNSLSRCCDPKGGAVKNSSIGGRIITTAGGQAIAAGSSYMYDIMSNTYNAMRGGEAMMAAATTGFGASAFSMSAYGLSMTYTAGAAGVSGTFSFAFDPTSFAVAVAVLVVVELTSCEKAEKELAQKNGAGLCRHYGSACNGFFCQSVTRSYCCFNSKLAKIINTAAVTQLGRANSDCSGLTMEEFGRMNFAAIDMGEFMAEIMSTVTLPSTGAINTDVNSSVQQKLLNYYTRGKQ